MRSVLLVVIATLLPLAGAPAQIPEGFEVVDIVRHDYWKRYPRMNNCGEVVFGQKGPDHEMAEVYYYDNGRLDRMTFSGGGYSAYADINDHGAMVWTNSDDEVVLWQDGVETVIGQGSGIPSINNLSHVVWRFCAPITCAFECDIFFHDGTEVIQIGESGLSNQSPELNDFDEIVWTRYDNCPPSWIGEIMLYSDGVVTSLPTSALQSQNATINNAGQVAWAAHPSIELWEDGSSEILTDWGRNPHLNNRGDIKFLRWHDENETWEGWLYLGSSRVPTFYRLTTDEYWNTDSDINDYGEIVWVANLCPYDCDTGAIILMRRVRNGDVNFDGDVDLDDFATFPDCMTGPIETDRLCDCRFFDMDHDRDVDLTDLTLFQSAFGG